MKALMSKVLTDLKNGLAVLGVLGIVAGQVVTYLPQTPGSQKGLGLVTTVIGALLALGSAALKILEAVQAGNSVIIDPKEVAAAIHTELSTLQSAATSAAPSAASAPSPIPDTPTAPAGQ